MSADFVVVLGGVPNEKIAHPDGGIYGLGACSQKHAIDTVQTPPQRLDRGAAVYVMVPQPGIHEGKTYPESGVQTAQAAVAALAPYASRATSGGTPETLENARRKAQSAGAAYIVEPTILNWEDRATEWSGWPDRITIKLVVWDTKSGKDVASTLARASSKWGTFGGDHPQDLLPQLMASFFSRIY